MYQGINILDMNIVFTYTKNNIFQKYIQKYLSVKWCL